MEGAEPPISLHRVIERKEVYMDNYIQYTYYDEFRKKIAIINKNTPKEIIEQLSKEYDEVKYKE